MSDAQNPKELVHSKGDPDRVEPEDAVIDVEVEIIEETETGERPPVPAGQGGHNAR